MLTIISWTLVLLPFFISLLIAIVKSEPNIVFYVLPWGMIGICIKAVFDFVFKLPMRVGYARSEKHEGDELSRIIMLVIAIIFGVMGIVIILSN